MIYPGTKKFLVPGFIHIRESRTVLARGPHDTYIRQPWIPNPSRRQRAIQWGDWVMSSRISIQGLVWLGSGYISFPMHLDQALEELANLDFVPFVSKREIRRT